MRWYRLLEQVFQNLWAYRISATFALISLVAATAVLYSALSFSTLARVTAEIQLGSLRRPVVSIDLYGTTQLIDSATFTRALAQSPKGLSGFAYQRLPVTVYHQGRPLEAYPIAATTTLAQELAIPLAKGALWSMQGLANFDRTCVVGADIGRVLGSDALGSIVVLGEASCTVIGVLADSPPTGFFDAIPNQLIWVPLSSAMRFGQPDAIHNLYLTAPNIEAENWIRTQLRAWEIEKYYWRDALSFTQGLEAQHRILKYSLHALTALLFGLAAIQLGSALAMNFRARLEEIGLRYCLGASPRHLRTLFLVEVAVLSLLGALVGLCLGIAATWALAQGLDWHYAFSWLAAISSVGLTLVLGILAGAYPIARITRWEPIKLLNLNY